MFFYSASLARLAWKAAAAIAMALAEKQEALEQAQANRWVSLHLQTLSEETFSKARYGNGHMAAPAHQVHKIAQP